MTREQRPEGQEEVRKASSTLEGEYRKLEELKRSEARFRKLVEHAADAFFVLDPEWRVLDVNQRACDSLGIRAASWSV